MRTSFSTGWGHLLDTTMKFQAILCSLLVFVWGSYGFLQVEPQQMCQGMCNSTSSCERLFTHCACPNNQTECTKSSLVAVNSTGITGMDQCCFCDNLGTQCVLDDQNTKDRGLNDSAKLIIVFFDNCEDLEINETTSPRFLGLFAEAFYNWTNINTTKRLVIEQNITCTSGDVPNCGVDVAGLTAPVATARRRRSLLDNKVDENKIHEIELVDENVEKEKAETRNEEKKENEEDNEEHETDPELNEIKSRVRRKIGGGRMRSSTKTKKGDGADLELDYVIGYGYVEEITTCSGMSVQMTLLPGTGAELTANETISWLTGLLFNESLTLGLSADIILVAEMMFFGLNNESLVMTRIPFPEKYDGPRYVPPMENDFRPFIYTTASLLGLFVLIVSYKMIKHSVLLHNNKFTRINSDPIKIKKVRLPALGRKKRRKESGASPLPAKQTPKFDTAFSKVPGDDDERLNREFNWTSPIYLPGMLEPVHDNNGSLEAPEYQPLDLGDAESEVDWEEVFKTETTNKYNTKF